MKRHHKDHLYEIRSAIDERIESSYNKEGAYHVEDVTGDGIIKDGVLFKDGDRGIYTDEQQSYFDICKHVLNKNKLDNLPEIPYENDKTILDLLEPYKSSEEIQVQHALEGVIESDGESVQSGLDI